MGEPSELIEAEALLECESRASLGRNTTGVREVPSSIPGRDGDCPDHGFIWCSSFCLGKCRDGTSKYTVLGSDMVAT